MNEFTEVYDTRTGLKQRVPAPWLDDPILGRFIKKTPSQRAFDGELGQAPTEESSVPEIRKFAEQAEIDVTGLRTKAELLDAVRAVVGSDPLPEPATEPDIADPTDTDPTDTDPASAGSENPDTPAAGDEEN